jgi:tetratricopeptide (TPR) repeat protein
LAGCAAPADAPAPPPRDAQANAFGTYLSARFAAGEHDLGDASRYFSDSLKQNPDDPDLKAMAFFYAASAGDIDQAAKYAVDIQAADKDDRVAPLVLTVADLKHHNYADVHKQLAQSGKGPFNLITMSLIDGWAAAAQGDAATATADMKTLAGQSGIEAIAAFHSALIADFLKQGPAADAFYKRAVTLSPASPRVIEAYGNFLERSGRKDDAVAYYRKYAGDAGLRPITDPALARLAAGKKPGPMIRSAEDGVAEALGGIAAQLTDRASIDVSILYLRLALYLRPDQDLSRIVLADRFESLQKYQDAVDLYGAIGKDSPYYRMSAVAASVDLTKLDRRDEAIGRLKNLAAADPRDAQTWMALGDALRDADRNDEAVEAYGNAEQAIPNPGKNDWPLFFARAMAEDKAHHWDKAEADLNTALKLSPDQPELLNYLGYSWVDQGRRIPEALAMLEKARTLRPYDGYIVDSVGWAYYRLGRYPEAAQTLEAAVLLVPGDPTINDHFGDALWKAGRKMEARFQWNHALAFSADDSEKASIERKLKSGLAG